MYQILRASVAFLQKTNWSTFLDGRYDATVARVSISGGNTPMVLDASSGCASVNSANQTISVWNAQNPAGGMGSGYPAVFASAYPPASITANLMLKSGKSIRTNSDFVVSATEDLAKELLALGWVTFTPPIGYLLQIPNS